MDKATFTMKVNYVKVVDELLQKKYKVVLVRGNPPKEKTFSDIVEEVIHKHCRPYTTSKQDMKDFEKEMKDRSDNNE
ncbi:unnamed protein product [marine sediment metagenome]|uniref:Uncharacterized protein n=1 Tax=marine sediment metagenome TaxID=412755 RepID=X1CZI6_9ZZZZ